MERAAGTSHRFVAERGPGRLRIAAAPGSHIRLGLCDHTRLPRLRACDQLRDQRGFRHVFPVFARHLLEHRTDLHAGGIEDAGIIGLPHRLGRIALGRVRLGRARTFGERLAVPVERDLRRQDRPAHRGEAVDEERRIGPHDMMFGLEPGDIARAVVILGLAKAQKGAHLVDVAPHRLGQPVEATDQRIGLILDQPGLSAQPVERGVEQRETLGIVGQDDAAREVDKCARYREAGGGGGRIVLGDRAEQIGGLLADLPHDLSGGTLSATNPRAASRQASKSSGAGRVMMRMGTRLSSPARGGGPAKLVEGYPGCKRRLRSRPVTPLRQAFGLPPPLKGEEYASGKNQSRSSPPGGLALASFASIGLRSS